MGACVSSYHKSSTMKVHVSSGSNCKGDDHVVGPPSPVKEKVPFIGGGGNVAVKPQWPPLHSTVDSRNFGSKEETFFDSQAWLDSDCDSDFMSVNGEFTPSRGNTPVHRSFTPPIKGGAPAIDDHKPSMTLYQLSTSPVKKSKRLSELFSESLRENRYSDEENSEPTDESGGVLKPKRERWVEIVGGYGCLPRVLSSCRPVTNQQMEMRRKEA